MRFFSEMMVFVHLVLCVVFLFELFTEGSRIPKVKWCLMIVFMPFVGVSLYELRRKQKDLLQSEN